MWGGNGGGGYGYQMRRGLPAAGILVIVAIIAIVCLLIFSHKSSYYGCNYTVRITTSCYSPTYTRDIISIAFGDSYGNQVYAPRLDNPSSGAFEQCSTDTYGIQGTCGYGVCYLYLRREGYDGWIPSSVEIYDPYYRRYVTFYYNTPLPNGQWYGYNNCYYVRHKGPAVVDALPVTFQNSSVPIDAVQNSNASDTSLVAQA